MNEQLGIDLGTTTSAVCRCTYEKDRVQGVQEYVPFNGELYDRTAVLVTGTLTNGYGETVRSDEEKFGWDAWSDSGKYPLLESGFKMWLISEDPRKQEKARMLTKKYFCHLHRKYKENQERKKNSKTGKTATVVTCPAKFSEELRKFLKEAAEEAGFSNVAVMNEAQAAMQYALSFDSGETQAFFRSNRKKILRVMLIDMGAGTTDIAIFEYDTEDSSRFTPIALYPKQGGQNFGGSEIDRKLYDHYVSKLGADYPGDYSSDGDAVLGERLLMENIKQHKEQHLSRQLLEKQTASAPMDLMRDARRSPQKSDLRLDREGFEALLKDYLPQFPALVNGALEEAKLSGEEIDLVLLTGGHSQWYFVTEILLNRMSFQKEKPEHRVKLKLKEGQILTFPKPHLVVAKGAAVINPDKKKPSVQTKTQQEESKQSAPKKTLLAPVKRNGKWGYIDQTGKVVIPCQWDDANAFREGLAMVSQKSKYGYIDKTGRIRIPCQWDRAYDFREGLAQVKQNGKYGYIDKTGRLISPCQWDWANNFHEGLAGVMQNGNWGYIDKTGKLVIPCQWDWANDFHEGLASVLQISGIFGMRRKYGYIDKKGSLVIPCQWDNADYFQEGLAKVTRNSESGYIDKTGRVVSPCNWIYAGDFYEGLARVKNGKGGYINRTGKLAIPYQWDWAYDFHDGRARVEQNKQYGYIDKTGKEICPCQWNYAEDFCEGFARVYQNCKYGYIDRSGRLVSLYKWKKACDFSEGLARVMQNGNWGYMDKTGKLVIPCQWADAGDFRLVE